MAAIGRVERVPLSEVWPDEARDFTTWLERNIDVLNEVLDIQLTSVEREKSVGELRVDLLAEDKDGNHVVIENQLGRSDHNHLGKLVTYRAVLGAKVAIWIVADPRPEHITAVTWLNQATDAEFYLLKVEAIRIGDSAPAPLISLIVGPSEEAKEVGSTIREWAERDKKRYEFWSQLLERARSQTPLHSSVSPRRYHYVGTSAGKAGLGFAYVIREHEAQVELYIDRGRGREDENRQIFQRLREARRDIEGAFGEPLEWQELEGKRAFRICKVLPIGGWKDEHKWPEIQEAMIDAMIRLERALRPHIDKLDI